MSSDITPSAPGIFSKYLTGPILVISKKRNKINPTIAKFKFTGINERATHCPTHSSITIYTGLRYLQNNYDLIKKIIWNENIN